MKAGTPFLQDPRPGRCSTAHHAPAGGTSSWLRAPQQARQQRLQRGRALDGLGAHAHGVKAQQLKSHIKGAARGGAAAAAAAGRAALLGRRLLGVQRQGRRRGASLNCRRVRTQGFSHCGGGVAAVPEVQAQRAAPVQLCRPGGAGLA